MKKTSLMAGVVVLALAGGGAWWWSQRGAADAVQYRTAKIERSNLQATVSASGAVNPVTQVSVGTQVSGQIKDLLVDFNSEVKAGQEDNQHERPPAAVTPLVAAVPVT